MPEPTSLIGTLTDAAGVIECNCGYNLGEKPGCGGDCTHADLLRHAKALQGSAIIPAHLVHFMLEAISEAIDEQEHYLVTGDFEADYRGEVNEAIALKVHRTRQWKAIAQMCEETRLASRADDLIKSYMQYVEAVWNCPNCGTGHELYPAKCSQCGTLPEIGEPCVTCEATCNLEGICPRCSVIDRILEEETANHAQKP